MTGPQLTGADALRIDPAQVAGAIQRQVRLQVGTILSRRGVVLGISGGIDSSVVAALCARALGKERVLGLLLPERESSPDSVLLAREPGRGNLTLTGKLGEVMQESARASVTYARSRAGALGVPTDFHEKTDLHVHVPEGAIPKDGPSAGITIATAVISALSQRPVKPTVGMTGEITLRGRVLPIGGLRDKVLAAHRTGLKTIIIPRDNERDLAEVPEAIRSQLRFVPVDHMDEVLAEALVAVPKPEIIAAANGQATLAASPTEPAGRPIDAEIGVQRARGEGTES